MTPRPARLLCRTLCLMSARGGETRPSRDVRDMSVVPSTSAVILQCRERKRCANSCREQMQQNACGGPALFDHLISKGEQLRGNFEAERLSGGQIDDQIKLGRLQHRQVGGLLAFENAAGVTASLLERIS